MANETNLRQANARVNVEGLVSEKDLKVVTENNVTKITGSLTVKTSEDNFVRFFVNVNEKTKDGKENKTYAGITTVMNEYKSIADVGEEAAEKVRVSGNLNLFRNQNTGQETITYSSNFFSRAKIDEKHPYNPHAEFSVEVFISSIVPETNAEQEETGRIVLNGWVPTYNGIEPIKLYAEDEIGAAVDSMFEPGQTVEFWGELINNRVEKITEIPVAIGKPRRKVETTFKNELIITGASEAYEEGVSAEKPYEAATIKAAIQERENRIAEARAQQNSNASVQSSAKPSGAAHGRTLGF